MFESLIVATTESIIKESNSATITSAGFMMTLTANKHSGMPLTSTIYGDLKKSFKELFE